MNVLDMITINGMAVKAVVTKQEGLFSSEGLNEPVVYLFLSDILVVTGEKPPELAYLGEVDHLVTDAKGKVSSVMFRGGYKLITKEEAAEKIRLSPLSKTSEKMALAFLENGVNSLIEKYRDYRG